MFGSGLLPTPKIFFESSGIALEQKGRVFLNSQLLIYSITVFKNACVTYIFIRV